jgi:dynein heavy chain
MMHTMLDIIRQASKDVNSQELRVFANNYCAQVSLLGIQLVWTGHVQEGLEKLHRERTILNTKKQKIKEMMDTLIQLSLQDNLNKKDRTKIEAMVTIHVHQRDVFNDLQTFLAKDTGSKGNFHNNFEWLKQTRIYWKMDIDNCIISITD